MQRRNFMKMAGALAIIPAVKSIATPLSPSPIKKEIYEWRVYTLNNDGQALDSFYQETLIPAYQRQHILVAAFKPYKPEEKEMRYCLFIYPDMATYHQVKRAIWQDPIFVKAAQPFYEATAPSPLYINFETYLCEAFDKIPVHRKADPCRSLFEIRLYWSPNEEANQRKVRMFNRDEIDIFDKVGIHSICYGEILAGPRMPALLYLTWYKDEASRAEAWHKFGQHPDWLRIRDMEEYANTATNNQSIFLTPMPYSQL